MGASVSEGLADGGAHCASKLVEFALGELAGGAAWVDPRLPESLVGEQVSDAGDYALVHDARFDRGGAPSDPRAELGAGRHGGVGAEPGEIGCEDCPSESPFVAERHSRAVFEREGEAVPAGVWILVDRDAPGHAEVKSEIGPVAVDLTPQRFSHPVCANEASSDQRRGDLACPVGAAHVGIAVVDGGDAPTDGVIGHQGAGAFRFGEFGHQLHDNAGSRLVGLAASRSPLSACV